VTAVNVSKIRRATWEVSISLTGNNVPYDAEKEFLEFSTRLAQQDGISLQEVLEKFNIAPQKKYIVGQNVGFGT
jgi:hypothetical protein